MSHVARAPQNILWYGRGQQAPRVINDHYQWNSFSNLLIAQGIEVFADLLSMKKALLTVC